MNNRQLKIRKILTSFGMFSLVLGVGNNSVYSRYILNNDSSINKINTKSDNLFSSNYQENLVDTYLVDNLEKANSDSDANVLISEIIIEGW